jgi:hypothetical protein
MKKYDIVIVSHEKDFNGIKHIVKHANENLNFDSIHLILSERQPYTELDLLKTLTDKPVYVHNETDVLKIDKTRLKHRPEWMYQMLLKIFQNVTQNDNFLIIESDCVIIKPLEFFDGDKTVFYLGRDHNHQQYFNFNQKVLGIGREYNHTFICEFMMYDKKIVKDLLNKSNCDNVEDFLELMYEYVNDDCYPADYELYGNFVYKFHNEKFKTKELNFKFAGRYFFDKLIWDDSEIEILISENKDKDLVTFHTWGVN